MEQKQKTQYRFHAKPPFSGAAGERSPVEIDLYNAGRTGEKSAAVRAEKHLPDVLRRLIGYDLLQRGGKERGSSPVKRTRSWLPQDDMAAASRGAGKAPQRLAEGENAVITVSPPPRPLAAATAAKSPLSEKAERCAFPSRCSESSVPSAERKQTAVSVTAAMEPSERKPKSTISSPGAKNSGLHLLAVDAEKAEIPAVVSGAVHAEKAFSGRPRGGPGVTLEASQRKSGVRSVSYTTTLPR